ncbi:hypothetical protein TorRG33x02_075730 [Trema orientale]|uniref:Uncharacterized protein n=1 Tax=Trema orientale TaxID=63057 RepID=A0A2P5FFP3_TREOI|nr:hypothetical protein TorRG33x02_075730 [Trema orientale]
MIIYRFSGLLSHTTPGPKTKDLSLSSYRAPSSPLGLSALGFSLSVSIACCHRSSQPLSVTTQQGLHPVFFLSTQETKDAAVDKASCVGLGFIIQNHLVVRCRIDIAQDDGLFPISLKLTV